MAWSVFQASVTDALGSLLFGGFLKVLGLAMAQVLPPLELVWLSHMVLGVTCPRCSQEPFHWDALEAVCPRAGAAWGAQGGVAPSTFLSCAPQHPFCPGESDKTHLTSAAFSSESSFLFVLSLWL